MAKPRIRVIAVTLQLFVTPILGGGLGQWAVGRTSAALRPD